MKDEKAEELLKELREKMEARRKELDLEWEENERERQGGGMLIVIAFIAGIAAIAGTVIYVLTRL
jgi:F0F1-type ATP synthase assembly protein I